MMANWGTITFVLIVFPLCYLLEIRGLRVATITVSVLVALGAVLRVISTDNTIYTISAHICAILNGFAGATIMSAPPALSAIWFPPEERTTATCINQVFNNLGNGVAFIMGPYLVPDRNLTNATLVSDVKKEIRIYMGIDAGWGVALLLAFLIYFPKQPPSPPSASASMPRTDFKDGFKAIVKDRNVWLCTFAYAMSGGINGAWQAVMTLNFAPLGVDDEESGRIGLVMCFSCCVLGIAISFGTDHLRKHIKVHIFVCVF
jgi:FLVCR family MFS transporter